MWLSNPWEPALTGQIQPVRAGSHGSDSTRWSRLSRVRFNPWESALTGRIQPVRASSHGLDSTRESRLLQIRFNPWELATTTSFLPSSASSQSQLEAISIWIEAEVRLMSSLSSQLETHPPGTIVSKTRSGLPLYYFMTYSWLDYSKIK